MPVESYGRVTSLSEQQQAPSNNNTIRRRRRQTTTNTYDNNNNNSTNTSNIHYNDNQQYQKEKKYDSSYTTTTSNRTKTKTHHDNMNSMTSFFPPILLLLIVPLFPILLNASSSINPLRYTIIGSLLVYAFDFIGPSATTETTIVWIIWATFFVVSFSFIYGQEQDFSNLWMIRLIRMGTPILHFICCASYMALQVLMSSSTSNSQINNIQEDDNFTFPKIMEDMIFTFTPLSFASILTYYYCTSSTSLVNTTTRTAHLTFPLLYSISMYYLLKSSPSQKQQQKYATIHFMVLLIFPILIYTTSQVIMASSSSLSESTPVIVEDLILAITLPLMIFQSLIRKFFVDDEPMETQSDITSSFAHKFIHGLKNMLSTNNNNNNDNSDLSATMRNRIILLFITCYVASKRYIVPTICVNISNEIYHGGYHDATANGRINITISSLFMTTSILLFMLSRHISRFNVYTNTNNNSSPEKEIFAKSLYFLSSKMSSPSSPDNLERAQEENIQDLFQLTVCIASFFLALSFGVSLRNAPIVLLPFLSIAIFISTRMVSVLFNQFIKVERNLYFLLLHPIS